MTNTKRLPRSSVPWTPLPYQLKAVQFLLEHACAGLLFDPGCRKTSCTLAALTFLKNRKRLGKVLIIAPLRVCYTVWPKEIAKWRDFNGLTYAIAHGKDKEAALKADVDIVLINPEGLDWLLDVQKTLRGKRIHVTVNKKKFKGYGFTRLVVDELSKFKHHDTGRHKALKEVLDTFDSRWGLTGSPAANGLLDLFGQAYVLDMGQALGAYITHYRSRFFYPDKYGHGWTLFPGAEDRIYELLEPLCMRQGRDIIQMPQLVEDNIYVQLPEAAQLIYDDLEKVFLAGIKNRTVTAVNAAAKSGKLRQVANGAVFLDKEILPSGLFKKGPKDWVEVHDEKIRALADLVDELQGQPLLVAYDFEHDIARLRKAFPKAVFAEDYNMKQFTALEEQWNRGEIPLLFGHPQSLGHGLNLQENAQHVVWFALTWNLELYEQFIDRIFRSGNTALRVFVHHIMAESTIDEVIYNTLGAKDYTQQAFFKGILEWAARRAA